MDFNSLRIFIAVVEQGSLSKAAEVLAMPVSTVSRRLQQLESQLGRRVFERSTRQIRLTLVGEDLYDHCVESIHNLNAASDALNERQQQPSGTLRLASPPGFAPTLLLPLLRQFRQYYPDIRIQLQETGRRIDPVADGIDLAFQLQRPEDGRVIAKPLLQYRHYLVASHRYLEENFAIESTDDLYNHDAVLFSDGYQDVAWQLHHPEKGESCRIELSQELSFNDYRSVLEAVEMGLGVADIPALICGRALEENRLQRILPEWQSKAATLYAVFPSQRHMSRAMRIFLDYCEEHLESFVEWDIA